MCITWSDVKLVWAKHQIVHQMRDITFEFVVSFGYSNSNNKWSELSWAARYQNIWALWACIAWKWWMHEQRLFHLHFFLFFNFGNFQWIYRIKIICFNSESEHIWSFGLSSYAQRQIFRLSMIYKNFKLIYSTDMNEYSVFMVTCID